MNTAKTAPFYDLTWSALDWLFPPQCVGCGKRGAILCDRCQTTLKTIPIDCCKKCGKPLHATKICQTCLTQEFSFIQARAAYLYEGIVREAIHQLKFSGNLGLANLFSKILYSVYLYGNQQVDLVTAVPLSQNKLNERGFNQSVWIGRPLATRIGVPFKSRALIKMKDTEPQVGLNRVQRHGNLKGAFIAEPKLVNGKKVLIVDDVMTTGATFQACAEALLVAGAKEIYCLSVATTDHFLKPQD